MATEKTIIVDYAAMETAKKEIMRKTEDYERLYNELSAYVKNLAQYQGVDRKAFEETVENFKLQIAKMKSALDGYANAIEKSRQTYEETQSRLEKEARSLNGGRSSLNGGSGALGGGGSMGGR